MSRGQHDRIAQAGLRAEEPLLPRDGWREAVFARDGQRCVVCQASADERAGVRLDAHHLIERRLWPDGGYYLSNGVTLCSRPAEASDCHRKAEQTVISCEELRQAAGLERLLLPPHLESGVRYDKWANVIGEDGTRYPGELFWEEPVQKALAEGGVLALFQTRFKMPRIPHLPWSAGRDEDDFEVVGLAFFEGQEVVVSEKIDGEATTVYSDGYVHARSIDSKYHPSRERVNALAATFAHELPAGYRVSMENMQARHSISYDGMAAWAYCYAIWNESNLCLSYNETVEWCALLGLTLAPELYRGPWDEERVRACWTGISKLGGEQEGYVVRTAGQIPYARFREHVAKFVRPSHVKTDSHWMHSAMVENQLASTS